MAKALANLTGSSIATNGYMEHPNGVIEQFGVLVSDATGMGILTFPKPFPGALINVQVTAFVGADTTSASGGGTWTNAGLNDKQQIKLIASAARACTFHWRALGV